VEQLEGRLAPAVLSPGELPDDAAQGGILAASQTAESLLAVQAPLANDDAVTINSNGSIDIDVLANDIDPDGEINPLSLTISSAPAHGTASVFDAVDWNDHNDDDSPIGNGSASAVSDVVDEDGRIQLGVAGYKDSPFLYSADHDQAGDYALFVRLGVADFAHFDRSVFDFQFADSLTPGAVDLFRIAGQTPGTPFVAWIDNTVGSGAPDTILRSFGKQLIEYFPDPGFKGADAFTYTVSDNDGAVSNEATVTVTILNQPPVADDDSLETGVNTPIAIDVLYLDYDPDGSLDASSLTVSSGPAHGTATVQPTEFGTAEIVYTPNPGFEGDDIFVYTVRDNDGAVSNPATVTVTVRDPPKLPPVAGDDTAFTKANAPVAIDVLANDYDPDGWLEWSSLTIATAPAHGAAAVQLTDYGWIEVLYTPELGFEGDDVLTYTVQDDEGRVSNPATVTITVRDLPPVAELDVASTLENTQFAIDVLANDFDPDGTVDPSTLAISSNPARGTVAVQDAMVIYTPDPGAAAAVMVDDPLDIDDGDYSAGHLSLREAVRLANADRFTDVFTYTVQDHDGLVSNQATVTIDVTPGPTAITFGPSLTAVGPAILAMSQVGDTSEGASALAISSNIALVGPSGNRGVTLMGQGSAADLRAFVVPAGGELTLENLTLTNWSSDGDGGVLYVASGGSATVNNSTLSHNDAFSKGGAIYNVGTLALTRSTLIGNRAEQGGGLANVLGTATLTDGTFSANQARDGAGLSNEFGEVFGTGTTFAGNRADDRGGGMFNDRWATVTLMHSILSGNSAREGGGFYNLGVAYLNHCTISNNAATTGGGLANGYTGLILNPSSSTGGGVTLTDCTVYNNAATKAGGGLSNFLGLILTNTEIFGNRALQGGGIFNSSVATVNGHSLATMSGSMIANNHASQGGGIFNDLGTVTVIDSTVAGNSASDRGGGIFNRSTATLTGGALANNFAETGGGLYSEFGWTTIADSVVSDNGRDTGSGLSNKFGKVTVDSWPHPWQNPLDPAVNINDDRDENGNPRITVLDLVFAVAALREFGPGFDLDGPPDGPAPVTRPAPRQAPFVDVNGDELLSIADALLVVEALRDQIQDSTHEGIVRVDATPDAEVAVPDPQLPEGVSIYDAGATEYQLNGNHQLLSRSPGSDWTALDEGVLSFKTAPNGDLYLLNDRHELKRLKLGYSWTVLHVGVQSFTMDSEGTVYEIDNLNRVWMHRSLDHYYVLPPIPASGPAHALDSPSPLEVVRAAQIASSTAFWGWDGWIQAHYGPNFPLEDELAALLGSTDVPPTSDAPGDAKEPKLVQSPFASLRIMVQTIVDKIDSPRFFPGVGLAQLHHAQYKATIFASTVFADDEQRIVYIDHDHLHRYVPGSGPATTSDNFDAALSTPARDDAGAGEGALIASAVGPAVQRRRDELAQTLITAPDGTIYKLGGGETGWITLGSEPAPYSLWRLPPGANWQARSANPFDRLTPYASIPAPNYVYSFAVAPDSTLYTLTLDHELLRLPPGVSAALWTTLDTGVESFAMAPDGTLDALRTNGEQRRLTPGATAWTTLDGNVQSFKMSPAGFVYAVNAEGDLRRLAPGATDWSTLDVGVQAFTMTSSGAVYALNGLGQLKRLTDGDEEIVLDSGVESFTLAPDGGVYVLTDRRELKRLTDRDHWTVLEPRVLTFQISPNGDLYLINDRHELKRLKRGYSWTTLQVDAQSLAIYSDGTAYVRDSLDRLTLYSSLGPYFVLGPIPEGNTPVALDPPSEGEVVRAANLVVNEPYVQYFPEGPEFPLSGEAAAQSFAESSRAITPDSGARSTAAAVDSGDTTYPRPPVISAHDVRIVVEPIADYTDPPRYIPELLYPALMHHAQYKCTINYLTDADVEEQLVVYIDHDHLHPVGPPT
jgi:hypothetical protein